MILYAPAKLNLYLRVLGKRKDGYHNIETVFEKIALFDKIIINPANTNRIKIFCDHPGVPVDKKSLLYRTIDVLRKKAGIKKGAEVKVFKKIPIAAGLGGGSSDAAALLKGLNRLWKASLSMGELLEISKPLGADIPFFVTRHSCAAARGIGDEISPFDLGERFWHLVITPPVKLLSRDVYRENKEQSGYSGLLQNDLEKTVLKKAPIVIKLKKALKNIGIDSLVSGSGPSVFSIFEKRKEAFGAREALTRRFPVINDKGWQTFVVPTL